MNSTKSMCAFAIIAAALSFSAPAIAGGDVTAAREAPRAGWYVEVRVSEPANHGYTSDFVSPNTPAANGEIETSPKSGIGFTAVVGKYIRPKTRVEVEYSYANTDDIRIDYDNINPLNVFFGLTLSALGEITMNAAMVSALHTIAEWNVRGHTLLPFIGVGVGVTHVEIDNVAPATSRFVVDDSDTMFAAAVHVGLDIPLTDGVDLTGRYSGTYISSSEFDARDTLGLGGIARTESDGRYAHVVGIGLRFRLRGL